MCPFDGRSWDHPSIPSEMVAGFRATMGVVKARIHREGETSMADDRGCSLGAIAGPPVALLLAPQSSHKSREQLYGMCSAPKRLTKSCRHRYSDPDFQS